MTSTTKLPTSINVNQGDLKKGQLWTGRVLWAISVPFLLLDTAMHIAQPAPVLEACQKLQIPVGAMLPLGLVQLACLILYIIPRTAVLGAVLLTGYLGGAVAIHMRIGDPLWFPFVVGGLLWGSLYCRDARVRSLFK